MWSTVCLCSPSLQVLPFHCVHKIGQHWFRGDWVLTITYVGGLHPNTRLVHPQTGAVWRVNCLLLFCPRLSDPPTFRNIHLCWAQSLWQYCIGDGLHDWWLFETVPELQPTVHVENRCPESERWVTRSVAHFIFVFRKPDAIDELSCNGVCSYHFVAQPVTLLIVRHACQLSGWSWSIQQFSTIPGGQGVEMDQEVIGSFKNFVSAEHIALPDASWDMSLGNVCQHTAVCFICLIDVCRYWKDLRLDDDSSLKVSPVVIPKIYLRTCLLSDDWVSDKRYSEQRNLSKMRRTGNSSCPTTLAKASSGLDSII